MAKKISLVWYSSFYLLHLTSLLGLLFSDKTKGKYLSPCFPLPGSQLHMSAAADSTGQGAQMAWIDFLGAGSFDLFTPRNFRSYSCFELAL